MRTNLAFAEEYHEIPKAGLVSIEELRKVQSHFSSTELRQAQSIMDRVDGLESPMKEEAFVLECLKCSFPC